MGTTTQVEITDSTGALISATNPLQTAAISSASTTTVLNQASAAQTATGNTGDLAVGALKELAVDANVTVFTGGTAPSITFSVQRKGADGVYYTIWTGTAVTAPGAVSTGLGTGATVPAPFGGTVRLVWTFGGTVNATSITLSASILGK